MKTIQTNFFMIYCNFFYVYLAFSCIRPQLLCKNEHGDAFWELVFV